MLTLTAALEPGPDAADPDAARREVAVESTSFQKGREEIRRQLPPGWRVCWIRTG